jgi:RNA polymerase sigma factor (sigma-70 family)
VGATDGAAVEQVARDAVPRVVGRLTRRFGDFDAAEDAVQEALAVAVERWPRLGVPDAPEAWLARTAEHKLIDQLRADSSRRRREENDARRRPAPPPWTQDQDDSLALLFWCCHPALGVAASVGLTLRSVGGLTTAEIARAFLVPEATMAQRISRAKQRIRAGGETFGPPDPDAADWPARLEAVLRVLYLIFNEGYATSSGPQLLRIEPAREAIRLTRMLHAQLPDSAEAAGLLALMLLTDARAPARTGPHGELVPLAEQDRSRWDAAAIAEGTDLITRTLGSGRAVGPYQVQAAIAAVHDEAAGAQDTDWPQILALYQVLEQVAPSPVVSLNRAVAAAMVHGPAEGLRLLDALAADPRLADHHRLYATRAHLRELLGQRAAAVQDYQAAAARTASLPERTYLLLRAARLH